VVQACKLVSATLRKAQREWTSDSSECLHVVMRNCAALNAGAFGLVRQLVDA